MRRAFATISTVMLCGCIPIPMVTTKQPEVNLIIVSETNVPIENAQFHLATYSVSFTRKPGTIRTLRSEPNGYVNLPKETFTQVVILAPDQGTFYRWAYCVEKAGHKAVSANNLDAHDFKPDTTVVLPHSDRSTVCNWNDREQKFETK